MNTFLCGRPPVVNAPTRRARNFRRPSLLTGSSIAACLLALAPVSRGVDGAWTSLTTGGLWSNVGNWSGGVVADGTDGLADFSTLDLAADNLVHLDTPRTIGNLTFGDTTTTSAGGWTIDSNNDATTNVLTLAVSAGTPTITVNALGTGKVATIQANIAGVNGLTKAGTGTLTLSGSNSYTGGTTINAGVLNFGTAAAIAGAGANVTVNANGTATLGTGLAQALLDRVTGSSTGTVALLAANANALDFNTPGLNSLTLGSTGAFAYTGTLTPAGGTYRLGGGGGTLTLSGTNALTGLNSLIVTLGSLLTSKVALSGANDFSGGTTINGGFLILGGAGATNSLGSGPLNFNGGTLQWATGALLDISSGRTVTFGTGGATLDVGTNNVTLASSIGNNGVGDFSKAGTGTLTLSGANTYGGATIVNAGVLAFGSTASIGGTGASVLVNAAGSAASVAALDQNFLNRINSTSTGAVALGSNSANALDFSATGANLANVSLGASVSATYSGTITPNNDIYRLGGGGNTLTLSNPNLLTGTRSLVISSAGIATSKVLLSAANDYTGGTTISSGTLLIGTDSSLGSTTGGVTFAGNSTLQFGAGVTLGAARTLTFNTGFTGTLDAQANATVVNSSLAGAGTLAKIGTGQITYSGTGTYAGPLAVNAGIFRVSPGATLSSGALTTAAIAGVQFYINGGNYTATGLATINNLPAGTTTSGFLLDSGSASFPSGLRTGVNDGAVIRVTGGTFSASDVSVQRDSSTATNFTVGFIASGGTSTIGTLGIGTGNSAGHASFEGTSTTTVSGAITVGRQQTGTGTTIRGGFLQVKDTAVLTSTDTADGLVIGRTNANGQGGQTAAVTLAGGTTTVEKINFQYDTTLAGTGTLTVSGGNLYVGSGGIGRNAAATTQGITINLTSGLVGAKADWSSSLLMTTGATATNNITLKAADASNVAHDITLSGELTGSGGFTKTGAGTLTLAANNTYTGGSVFTTISAGTLQVGNGGTTGSLGTSANKVINNGILSFNRSNTLTVGNVISGSGAVQQIGGGTTLFSNAQTYTGNTTVSNGTLRISSTLASPLVSVNAGATFGGSGTAAGSVVVDNGARITPSDAAGTGPGTLTVGSLSLSSGSTLDLDFTSLVNFDKVIVSNTNGLTANGAGINLYATGTTNPWTFGGSYNLFQYSGTLGGLAATDVNSAFSVLNPQSGFTYQFGTGGGFVTLSIASQALVPTWNLTSGGTWASNANWNTAFPNAQDATALFGSKITAPSIVTLDGNKTVGTLQFSSTNAYTIAQGSGGTLFLDNSTLTAAINSVAGNHTVSAPISLSANTTATVFDIADTLTLNSVGGLGALTKSGAGTLALAGVNTYAGGTTINAGTLQIKNDQALSSGSLTFNSASNLQAGANNLAPLNNLILASGVTGTVDTNGNTMTIGGIISDLAGNGGLTKIGTGRLNLTGANTYSGATTVSGGTLSVATLPNGGVASPIGQSSNLAANLVLDGGALEYTGGDAATNRLFRIGTNGGEISAMGSGAITFAGPGAVAFAGTNNIARTLTLSGTNLGANTLAVTIGNNGTGATSLVKSGTGSWVLSGANTFTGDTVVSAGLLTLANATALGASTLNYDNQGGTLSFGALTAATLGGIKGSQTITLANDAATPLALTVNPQANVTYAGKLTGPGSFTKTGVAGTVFTLTGQNDYTGTTTLNTPSGTGSSTLEVSGTLGSGALVLTGNALLHVTGGTVIAPTLNLNSTGTNGGGPQITIDNGSVFTVNNSTALDANQRGTNTSVVHKITVNGGTVALGAYSSGRDGNGNDNVAPAASFQGLIINGGNTTASSVTLATSNSWSNLTVTGGTFTVGNSLSANAFRVGAGSGSTRGGVVYVSGGELNYLGADAMVLNASTGLNNQFGVANFSGGISRLTGIALNGATTQQGKATLTLSGSAAVYLGSLGITQKTSGTVLTSAAGLVSGTLGALADWSSSAPLALAGVTGATAGTVTFLAADESNVAHNITLNGALTTTTADFTVAANGLAKAGAGTLTLAAANNTYSGTTNVNAGTLVVAGAISGTSAVNVAAGATVQLGLADVINNTATVSLTSATLDAHGFSDTVGALTLAGNSSIDLGTGASLFHFADSSAVSWTGTLSITNWSGSTLGAGTDQLFFGNSAAGLTSGQVALIQFLNPEGLDPGSYGAAILASGELVAVVPEPGVLVSLLGGAAVLLGFRRRRG